MDTTDQPIQGKRVIAFRLPERQITYLEVCARRLEISKSELLRRIIDAEIARE